MKAIEQTSLVLLSASLLILAIVLSGVALDRYVSRAPLYTPPPESKDFSHVKSMREATSLEGLKQVCTFWAEREDQSQKFVQAVHSQFTSVTKDVLTIVIVLVGIFSVGSLYIYVSARRLTRASQNAL
jgi:hypothetical protein